MARIRKIEIQNFRAIESFEWTPSEGMNCLIGPGDSGKSTILDAIDLCLGARRNFLFTDADFYLLEIDRPILIRLTIGDLDEDFKSIETYGLYLRSFCSEQGEVEDEPERNGETVLCLSLTVGSDLEPSWTLFSDRATAQGVIRNLTWSERSRLSPTRLGEVSEHNLSWRRGSVLNRLSREQVDPSTALIKAVRDARKTFGEDGGRQVEDTLGIVARAAEELGVPTGGGVKAMLDPSSVNYTGGSISLHNEQGIPLSSLGTGSTRLLVAGLQRHASESSKIVLVDELEHGLEPHRIIRLIGSLGAKEKRAPLQVFATTHSPVVLRELSGDQLFILRKHEGRLRPITLCSKGDDDVQGTLRSNPEAFLASSVIVCEGASEVGLLRGLDQYLTSKGRTSLAALGVALVDSGGVKRIYSRALPLLRSNYRVATLRDDDEKPVEKEEAVFSQGGSIFKWSEGRALEDEIFHCLTVPAVVQLLALAVVTHGRGIIDDHLKSSSMNQRDLTSIESETSLNECSSETRKILAKASRSKNNGWFKNVTTMEEIGRQIVGPDLRKAEESLRSVIIAIFKWAARGAR